MIWSLDKNSAFIICVLTGINPETVFIPAPRAILNDTIQYGSGWRTYEHLVVF